MFDSVNDIDFTILYFIHDKMSCGFLNWLMPKISFLGNKGLIWIAVAIVMMCFKKYRKNGILLIAGLLAGVIIGNLILKNIIGRERPCWINNTVQIIIRIPKDYSFPSGHTLSSFVAATIIFNADKKFGASAFIFAVMIAFSRLYLFVHFPTDVLGGIILGIMIGEMVCIFNKMFIKRQTSKNISIS